VQIQLFLIFSLLLFILGWVCLITQKNIFKQVIGLKILLQSVTLALALGGWYQNNLNLAQAMIISALVVEAIVNALALAMIVSIYRDVPSGEIDLLRKLRG
jgi:NADH:ubiquinone oxidoreductase subunit K